MSTSVNTSDTAPIVNGEVNQSYGSIGDDDKEVAPELETQNSSGSVVGIVIRKGSGLISTNTAFMHFLRAQIASGYLTLPYAFKQGGLFMSLCLSPLIGLVNTVCMLDLVETSQHLSQKAGREQLDYGHLAKKAFDYGPERLRKHSKKALYVTNACIGVYQIGVCGVQASFVAINIIGLLCWLQSPWIPTLQQMLTMLLPFLLAMNYIPSLDALSYLSTLGNIILCGGVFFVLQYLVRGANQINALPQVNDFWDVTLYVGNAMYAYEGQTVLLPIENKMKYPKEMGGMTGVVTTTMGILASMFTAVGFFGYAKFGADTGQSITLNMPQNALYQGVNMALTAAVLLGYSLQLYVPLEMLWPGITRKYLRPYVPQRWHGCCMYGYRHLMVLISYALAMAVPKLNSLLTLVGVSVGMIISFIVPPSLHLLVFWEDWTFKQKCLYLTRDMLIIVLSSFFCMIGTYATLMDIYNTYAAGTSGGICQNVSN